MTDNVTLQQRRTAALVLLLGATWWLTVLPAQEKPAPAGASVSTGFATALKPASPTQKCTNAAANVQPDVFPVSVGTVRSSDGKEWVVPGPVQDGPVAVDLYNDCTGTGDNPGWEKQLQTVIVDQDGVDITGYIFGDNYYELY